MRAARIIALIALVLSIPFIASAQNFFIEQDMCVLCHLLGENLGAPNPVIGWNRSVHFRPDSTCTDCHGGNKYFYSQIERGHIGLPDPAGVIAQCAKCHSREAASFSNRPPGEAGKFNCTVTCISCHDHHRVEKAGLEIINQARCGKCHAFDLVEPHKNALADLQERILSIQQRIGGIEDAHLPVESLEMELAVAWSGFADLFHEKRSGEFRETATLQAESLKDLEDRVKEASPRKWNLSGLMVVGFFVTVTLFLIGYQSVAGSIESGKEDTGMAQDNKIKTHQPSGGTSTSEAAKRGRRRRSPWGIRLALLFATIALVLAIQGRFASTHRAVKSVNKTVTRTVVPDLKKANERAMLNSLYELKRISVSLDEIRETSTNEEIKSRIDQLKMDIDELAVKILVHE